MRTRATRTGSNFAWGKGLIAGQVALSLLVLFAAGLLVRSLQKLMTQDFGYPRDHLVIARLDPTSAGYSIRPVEVAGPAACGSPRQPLRECGP